MNSAMILCQHFQFSWMGLGTPQGKKFLKVYSVLLCLWLFHLGFWFACISKVKKLGHIFFSGKQENLFAPGLLGKAKNCVVARRKTPSDCNCDCTCACKPFFHSKFLDPGCLLRRWKWHNVSRDFRSLKTYGIWNEVISLERKLYSGKFLQLN